MAGMTALSLETLKDELTPRISTDDLFSALSGPSTKDASGRQPQRERVLLLDVRPKDEYLEGGFLGWLCLLFVPEFRADFIIPVASEGSSKFASISPTKKRSLIALSDLQAVCGAQ